MSLILGEFSTHLPEAGFSSHGPGLVLMSRSRVRVGGKAVGRVWEAQAPALSITFQQHPVQCSSDSQAIC